MLEYLFYLLEEGVDGGDEEEGEGCGEEHAADNGDGERVPQIRALGSVEGHGEKPHHGRRCRHDNGPEPIMRGVDCGAEKVCRAASFSQDVYVVNQDYAVIKG